MVAFKPYTMVAFNSSHAQAHIQSPHLSMWCNTCSNLLTISFYPSPICIAKETTSLGNAPLSLQTHSLLSLIHSNCDNFQPIYVDNLSFRWGPLWRRFKLQFSMSLANIWIIKIGLNCLWKLSSEITLFLHLHKYQHIVMKVACHLDEKPILSIKKKQEISYKIIGNHMKLYLDCVNAIPKYMKNNFIPITTTQTSGRDLNTPFTPSKIGKNAHMRWQPNKKVWMWCGPCHFQSVSNLPLLSENSWCKEYAPKLVPRLTHWLLTWTISMSGTQCHAQSFFSCVVPLHCAYIV